MATKKQSMDIPVTSIVQILRNRELGVRKPHTRGVTDLLESYKDSLMLTGGLCARSSKEHNRIACFQHRYKNLLDYFRGPEDVYIGRMDMPSPSMSCKSDGSTEGYMSDQEIEDPHI
ncbi:unnamed protein product [Lasius platythorax]|uniref:Uncharacterized protein n=1 Tax=Lasius platythorax TaxID=488582 RepID=A0AAV2MZ76_9HYME